MSKLVSNSAYYMLIGLSPMLISFFTVPIVTGYLSTSEYGILALVRSFVSLIAIVGTLQLFSGVNRFYFDYDKDDVKKYFSSLLLASVVIISVVFTSLFFFGDDLVKLLFNMDDLSYHPLFFYATITICFNIIVSLTTAFFKVEERAKQLLIISAIMSVVGALITILFVVFFELGLLGVVQATMVNSFILMVVHLLYFRKYLRLQLDTKCIKEGLSFGLPVLPHALGGYLFMYSDKIILANFMDASYIGLYAIADRMASLFKSIVNSFARSFNPNFTKKAKESIEAVKAFSREVSHSWFIILGILYFVLCNFSEFAIYIITPEAYHKAYLVVPILGLAYVFRGIYILSINSFYFTKKTKYLPIATVSSGLLNVGLNIWLIPYWGLYGAAITTTLCFFLNFVFFEILSRKKTFSLHYSGSSAFYLTIICIFSLVSVYLIRMENEWYLFFARFAMLLVLITVVISFNLGDIQSFIKKRFLNGKGVRNS